MQNKAWIVISGLLAALVPIGNAAFGWHLSTTDVLAAAGALSVVAGAFAHIEAQSASTIAADLGALLDKIVPILKELSAPRAAPPDGSTTVAAKPTGGGPAGGSSSASATATYSRGTGVNSSSSWASGLTRTGRP